MTENNTDTEILLARAKEQFILVAVAFALACRELEQMSEIASSEWSDRIGNEAFTLVTNDNIPASIVEEVCAQVFNKGEKL